MLWIVIIFLFFLIVYPYTVYPLILKFFPKYCAVNKKRKFVGKMSVTLFIAAFNEEKVIGKKLENSLELNSEGIDYEIFVGSDGSTDATNQIVRQYEKRYSNIRLLDFKERQGKVNVLNRGIPLCNGGIILLSDANAMYNSECLQRMVTHFRDSRVGCVAGEKRMLQTGEMISKNEGLYWKLESKIKRWESQVKTVIGADGACYAIRKSLFIQLPSNTSVDDFLLSMKIIEQGYRIVYEPDAYSVEEAGTTMQAEMKRKIRIASGNYYNLRFLKNFFKPSIVSWMFLSHKFLRWISPFLFIFLAIFLGIAGTRNYLFLISFIVFIGSFIVAVINYTTDSSKLINNKFINFVTYFYLTVFSQLLGAFKCLLKTQESIWETIRS